MNSFLIGINYWASNAGTEMWSDFDESVIEKDMAIMADMEINAIRIFPIWEVFQPIRNFYTCNNEHYEVMYTNGNYLPFTREGRAGVDPVMIERFRKVMNLAEKYKIGVIIGLITGWMSGKMYVPPLADGKNLISDPEVVQWQLRFIEYMVEEFKDSSALLAWDFGNECNCLSPSTKAEALVWMKGIYNAIHKIDGNHPVFTGLNSGAYIDTKNGFTRAACGEASDILCTHPYNFFHPECLNGESLSFRSLMHSSCESALHEDISGKPCVVEEIGTVGPMYCDELNGVKFMRMNLFETLSQGFKGFLWWCTFDQIELPYPPYDWWMLENELGVIDKNGREKAFCKEIRNFSKFIRDNGLMNLPTPLKNAVCYVTKNDYYLKTAFGAYMLARQAGFNPTFCDASCPTPVSEVYMIPSVTSGDPIYKHRYAEILDRVYNDGATLYISMGRKGCLSPFEEVTGCRVKSATERDVWLEFGEYKIQTDYIFRTEPTTGKVLLKDDKNGVNILYENSYGKGKVYTIMVDIETILTESTDDISENNNGEFYKIYKYFAPTSPAEKTMKNTAINFQDTEDGILVTVVSAYEDDIREKIILSDEYTFLKPLRGEIVSDGNVISINLKSADAAMFYIKRI